MKKKKEKKERLFSDIVMLKKMELYVIDSE